MTSYLFALLLRADRREHALRRAAQRERLRPRARRSLALALDTTRVPFALWARIIGQPKR